MSETVATAKDLVRTYMEANIPVFIEGPPGVGKSELAEQLAREKKIKFLDIRLAQMDPVDLRGLPTITGGQTVWTRPDFWPSDPDWEGIILFDELADCGRAMQSAAYQIILNRRAGPHELPRKAYPMAAGNRRQDRAAAQSISSALASRFAWIEVVADHKCLLEYAAAKEWHDYVRAFLNFKPGAVHNMEGADLRAFPCPRQWERVSRILQLNPTRDQLLKLIAGLVGEGTAGEFHAFLKTIDIPDLDEIVSNPKKCRIPAQPSSKYALACMLSRCADRQNFAAIMTYVAREQFGRDFEIVTVLDAIKRDITLMHMPVFITFANKNKDLRIG